MESSESAWCHSGDPLGMTLGSALDDFGLSLGSLWCHVGATLRIGAVFGFTFGITLELV